MKKPDISLIISTYNAPEWLEKVLIGYNCQTFRDFEVIIADDGSGNETFDIIDKIKSKVSFPIHHVWHEDRGFQKSQILNSAILACSANYILMSDGDCIPRMDFVAQHMKNRKRGYFLSGGYFKLSMPISKEIGLKEIENQSCFSIKWLKKRGLSRSIKNLKLTISSPWSHLLNLITPTKASWNGHNASGWKEDILAVNGFDERMQYGGQDRELGERMVNYGIRSKQIRYGAICVHLDHPRGYKNDASIRKNKGIRKTTKREQRTWTKFGIKKDQEIKLREAV